MDNIFAFFIGGGILILTALLASLYIMSNFEQTPQTHGATPPEETLATDETIPENDYVRMNRAWWQAAFSLGKAWQETAGKTVALANETTRVIYENTTKTPELPEYSPDALHAYTNLLSLFQNSYFKAMEDMTSYSFDVQKQFSKAFIEASYGNTEPLTSLLEEHAKTLDIIAHQNPEAIDRIKPEVGFDFENEKEYTLIHETPRAYLYQIHPLTEGREVDPAQKPVLLFSPFILTDGIQALLPHQGISFAHRYANEGIPTYVIRFKDIVTTPEVATMSPEAVIDDAVDFLTILNESHQRLVTVVGTCQGAYMALAGFTSGKFSGLANQAIFNVPPIDLSQSPEWQKLLQATPPVLRDIDCITTTLPHGEKAVSGAAAALSMRLKDPTARENPLSQFITALRKTKELPPKYAAVQAWLDEVVPLPREITRFSQLGAETPIADDGTMPQTLYGQPTNVVDSFSKGGLEHLHIIYGTKDDVVTPEVALRLFSIPAVQTYLADHPEISLTSSSVEGGHIAPMINPLTDAVAVQQKFAEQEGERESTHTSLPYAA